MWQPVFLVFFRYFQSTILHKRGHVCVCGRICYGTYLRVIFCRKLTTFVADFLPDKVNQR